MAVVEILEVSSSPPDPERLLGYFIEAPVTGSLSEVYAINMRGWVLGRRSQAVAVEVVHDGIVVCRIPITVCRPDIAAAFPKVPGAEQSGFHGLLSVLGMAPELNVLVQAILHDQSRVPLGMVRARRCSLRSTFQPRLQPLVLTTTGRSGSTWLTQLLGQHPQIITYRPYEYEPRVASYWMQILETLSDPASYLQLLDADVSDHHWWLGNKPPLAGPTIPDPQIQQHLGRNSIEELVAFCQNRIEAFYEQVAATQNQSEPVYFVERCNSIFAKLMMRELYPQAREIFLVRDFRDMLCSIFAFNKRQNTTRFGRERANSDQDYVWLMRDRLRFLFQDWRISSNRAHLLRYEDLIRNPEETLTSVLEYLKLDSDPATVRRTLQTAMERTPRLQQEHQTSASMIASIGRWRRDLDASLQALCQEAFGNILTEFGYDDD